MPLACLVVFTATLIAQRQTTPASGAKNANRVPAVFQRQIATLGKRLQAPGKERSIYIGEVTDRAGNRSTGQVIHQIPSLVRLAGFKAGRANISFDGTRTTGVVSRDDEAVLETFVMDLPEGMLASIQGSAAFRLIGLGSGPDPRSTPRYTGLRYDIFEVTAPSRSRSDQLVRSKLYYFDSQTGLLQSTRYYDRSRSLPLRLETRFSQWRNIDGSVYPGRIDHFEGGQLLFSFTATTIQALPAVDSAEFR